MQRFWKVVLEARGCTPKQAVAMRLRLRNAKKSLEWVGRQMALKGITNGGGEPYHREQVDEFVREGLRTSLALVCDKSLVGDEQYEARIARAVDDLLRRKVRYSCSTPRDPYLKGRLEWWRLRKTGKKRNSSQYDRKTR